MKRLIEDDADAGEDAEAPPDPHRPRFTALQLAPSGQNQGQEGAVRL